MRVESNINPMYCVLDCYPKLSALLCNKPLITLHSFLLEVIRHVILTVTVTVTVTNSNQFTTMNLDPDGSYDPNDKLLILVVTLRLSSVRLFSLC